MIRRWPVVPLLGLILSICGCQGLQPTANTGADGGGSAPQATLQSINHIVFMLQENRSFDHYFGQLPAYWQAAGFPPQQFDGLPAGASNPSFDGLSTVAAYHLQTECFGNLSPSWNESHDDWNRQNPTSSTATMDGYVFTAASYAQTSHPGEPPIDDTAGIRAMGYYDSTDLNYYYFMASNFATSDRWFSPVMSRTPPNRLYLLAATSAGHAYPPTAPLTNKTIFESLDAAGISWKIYETDPNGTYLNMFQPYATQHAANIAPVSQYLTDVQNGTLPSVAMIESGYSSGKDEHPDNNVQTGAAYVSSLINPLMGSVSWKDSVFILTFDEGGGTYDHVPPQPAKQPDGVPPSDLLPTDICAGNTEDICDFKFTGFRVPLIIVSPFTRKNYVSHSTADYTAILKLIETRFKLQPLTNRDAAQIDMTEFFDFKNIPWATPPANVPPQVTTGVCDFSKLQ
jgi:phospholipase C